jgi:hypothetical protein
MLFLLFRGGASRFVLLKGVLLKKDSGKEILTFFFYSGERKGKWYWKDDIDILKIIEQNSTIVFQS